MRLSVAATLVVLAHASPTAHAQTAGRSERPALVVFIAVDQFRGDYLDRFSSQLTGGLARFRNNSAFFPHAWQDHSITETAPGHATMLSGREPVHTEIISNNRGVPDELSPLIGSNAIGASPRRFVGTTLYDWLRVRDPEVRVLSVSRKDRGAILTVGRARGDVYWFSDGKFTTSRYYADTLPTWVRAFDDYDPSRAAGRAEMGSSAACRSVSRARFGVGRKCGNRFRVSSCACRRHRRSRRNCSRILRWTRSRWRSRSKA